MISKKMKFHETHFEEYLAANKKANLHPKLEKRWNHFPEKLADLKNVLLYGPQGIGKYTQMLCAIKRYSPSELKYEKKMSVTFNKQSYYIKISDVHYEVDMSLLGCNSKLLWHEIYLQIIDIVSTKTEKVGIIVCKNFHEVHSELLENFYSYMQKNNVHGVDIKYFFLTEQLSFLPDNILQCCEIVCMERPKKAQYQKCIAAPMADVDVENITNMKNLYATTYSPLASHKMICDSIVRMMLDSENMKFLKFRDLLYDLFIYHLDVSECVWYIVTTLFSQKKIPDKYIPSLMIKLYCFFQYYNNNYRPIYHVESILLYVTSLVHNYPTEQI
jgi:hypothetical protein